MQTNPRILVKLLVILVNLPVKLTGMNPMGAMGGGLPSASPSASRVRGIHLGEQALPLRQRNRRVVLGSNRPWANPPKDYWLDYELGLLVMLVILVISVRPLVRLLVISARLLVRLAIVARLCQPFTGFSDFLGRYSQSQQSCIHVDYLFTCTWFFFR